MLACFAGFVVGVVWCGAVDGVVVCGAVVGVVVCGAVVGVAATVVAVLLNVVPVCVGTDEDDGVVVLELPPEDELPPLEEEFPLEGR